MVLTDAAGEHRASRRSTLFVAGCVAAIGMAFLAALLLPSPIVTRLMENDVRARAELWVSRIVSQIGVGGRAFETRSLDEADRTLLSKVPRISDIVRLNLIDVDGEVFWSSDPEQIGTIHLDDTGHGGLAEGSTTFGVDSARARNVGEPLPREGSGTSAGGRHMAEVDVPVFHRGVFVGRVEVFVDVTGEHAIFLSRVRLLMYLGAGAMTAMFLALATFSTHSARRRMDEFRHFAERDRKAMASQLVMARDVRLLGELNEWLQSSRSLTELFEMVARFMTHLLPQSEGTLYVYSNSRDVLEGCIGWNGGVHKPHIHPEECWGLRRGRQYVFGQSEIDFVCTHAEPHDGRPYICFPVLAHGETVGLMHLRATPGVGQDEFQECRRLAQMCAEQVSLAIANVRMRDQLQDQSIRDPLTGLFNRRHLTDRLRRMVGKADSTGRPLSVLSLDVDHFKTFNDNFGHDAGDIVLRTVATLLDSHCEGDQLACRQGGEEFMVVLPDTPVDRAMQAAEAIRLAVEACTVRYGEKNLPRVTVSIGVAIAPIHGSAAQDLMRAADNALYAAKAAGRNCAVLAPLPGEGEFEDLPSDTVANVSSGSSTPPALAAE
jgi:diguanylate cyclase (GGDEF)-like protein